MHRLALAIPTFGRSEAIRENLEMVAADAARLGVAIYISDDSNDDLTEGIVGGFIERFDHIFYRRNVPSLGHDKNVLGTLIWPDADYVWLLGDTLRPKRGELEKMLEFLNDQDFVFVSRYAVREPDVARLEGDAARQMVRDKLWNQTQTGTTIYHRRVNEWARTRRISVMSNFPQLSVILGYASAAAISVGWYAEPAFESAPKGQSYWHRKAIDVFVSDWAALVTAYPDVIGTGQVARVLRSHSKNANLFSAKFLLELRRYGHFGWSSLGRPHFWQVMHLSRPQIVALLLLPLSAVTVAAAVKHGFERRAVAYASAMRARKNAPASIRGGR